MTPTSGRVGIVTLSPQSKLHLVGVDATTALRIARCSNNNYCGYSDFYKNKNASRENHTTVQTGDVLGCKF